MQSGAGPVLEQLYSTQPAASWSSSDKDTKGKLEIIVENDGSVVGENCMKWSSRVGDLIRIHIPIYYKDWRLVPKNFKDDVWNALMGEFKLNVSSIVARPSLEKSWPQKFRTYKSTLREHLEKYGPLGPGPKGVDPDHWRQFVDAESDPKKQLQKIKNAENRGKLEIPHCLGRCTYAQKMFTKKTEEPQKIFRRVDNWCLGHERKDGTVLESAKEKYDQLKAAEKKRMSMSAEDNNYTYGDLDNDELAEVFGKDTKGRVRAIGSHISKKQLIHLGIVTEKYEQMKKENEDALKKDELFSQFGSRLHNVEDLIKVVLHNQNKGSGTPVVTTPASDFASNSAHTDHNLVQNLENIFGTKDASHPSHPIQAPTGKSRVILCDKFGKELAKGFVVGDEIGATCHFKKVGHGEKKVCVEEVFDPDARLWDPPQGDDCYTLAGYAQGGFLIWLDCWLKYI